MTENHLPAAIQTFIEATNRGDTDTFVAAFTEDAYLNDWGREFHGHDGVRAWNRTDNIGVQSHFEIVRAEPGTTPGSYTVTLTDEFFTHAVAVLEQAQKTDGNLGADAFADEHNVWWDVTAWQSRAPIEVFMNTEPHLGTRGLADHLCDEATFVDWEQDDATLPDWQTSWRRLVADGRSAPLASPSDANEIRAFPAPVSAT